MNTVASSDKKTQLNLGGAVLPCFASPERHLTVTYGVVLDTYEVPQWTVAVHICHSG